MITSSELRPVQVNRYVIEDGNGSTCLAPATVAMADCWKPDARGEGVANPNALCVLLVANDCEFVRGLARMLHICGHVVQCASTGAGALKLASAFQPEFVLLDDELPDLSGYEIAALLHGVSHSAGMRIVSMSGYRGSGSLSQAAGCTHHLQKPVSLAAVEALVSGQSDAN
jgi:CheY-like chemotaxis protein